LEENPRGVGDSIVLPAHPFATMGKTHEAFIPGPPGRVRKRKKKKKEKKPVDLSRDGINNQNHEVTTDRGPRRRQKPEKAVCFSGAKSGHQYPSSSASESPEATNCQKKKRPKPETKLAPKLLGKGKLQKKKKKGKNAKKKDLRETGTHNL